jgi:hypothetical protein
LVLFHPHDTPVVPLVGFVFMVRCAIARKKPLNADTCHAADFRERPARIRPFAGALGHPNVLRYMALFGRVSAFWASSTASVGLRSFISVDVASGYARLLQVSASLGIDLSSLR